MRLFVSLNIEESIRARLSEIAGSLRTEIEQQYTDSVKWDKPENYHVTLFFIGDVEDHSLPKLINELVFIQKKFTGKEISFSSDNFNAFPDKRKPRILFAGLSNPDGNAYSLSESIRSAMALFGFKDDKPFHPHITLGRVKKEKRISLAKIEAGKFNIEFTCKEFFLMESNMRQGGSEYKVLRSFIL